MIEFVPYSLEVLKQATPYLKTLTTHCSDLSVGPLFMWQDGTDLQFCFWEDTLVMRQNIGEQPAFTWPVGANPYGMVDKLIEYVRINHLALRFYEVDDATLCIIKADKRFKSLMSEYEIRWSDYIYSFNDVLDFKGNKYKGQRNHINKFKRLYGEPDIRFITSENRFAVDKMLAKYQTEHKDANNFEKAEFERTKRLLDVYEELNLYCAGIFLNGEIIALSIGEVIGDMLLIHIEKALSRYDGVYPTMYQCFARLIAEVTGGELKVINREDDSGDPGLRISKLQYHPVGRVNKYLVHINSPAARLDKIPTLKSGNVFLTEIREDDKAAYLLLNTDIENNRFWGYDYRDDEDIIGEINENTFYDSAMLDMKTGDSINFAIRETLYGNMIGEAILWNFTYDGFAEAGCRIMPDCQNKGFGKSAFKAVTDFAEGILKLKVTARCYHQNHTSYRMIKSCGFYQTHKDDTYFNFLHDD